MDWYSPTDLTLTVMLTHLLWRETESATVTGNTD